MTTKHTAETSTTDLDAMLDGMLEGGIKRTSDIVGYWNPDLGPIACIPKHASVGDSKKYDPTKPSLLIFAELTRESRAIVAREEGEDSVRVVPAQAGDLVGIWYKPGMREIQRLAGVECVIARDARLDKATDKGNAMKGFQVRSKETGKLIPLTTDRRDKSRGVPTILDPAGYGNAVAPEAPKGPIPF